MSVKVSHMRTHFLEGVVMAESRLKAAAEAADRLWWCGWSEHRSGFLTSKPDSGPPGDLESVFISFNNVHFCLNYCGFLWLSALTDTKAYSFLPLPLGAISPSHRAFVPLLQWVRFFPQSGLHMSCSLSRECSLLSSKHSSKLTRLNPPYMHPPHDTYTHPSWYLSKLKLNI